MKKHLSFLLYTLYASTTLYCMQQTEPSYMPLQKKLFGYSFKKAPVNQIINLDAIPGEVIIEYCFPKREINYDLMIAISQLGYVGTPNEQKEYNNTLENYIAPLLNLSVVNKELHWQLSDKIKLLIPRATGVSLMQIFAILGYNTKKIDKISLTLDNIPINTNLGLPGNTFCGFKYNKTLTGINLNIKITQKGKSIYNDYDNTYFEFRDTSLYDILHTNVNKLFLAINQHTTEFNDAIKEMQTHIHSRKINTKIWNIFYLRISQNINSLHFPKIMNMLIKIHEILNYSERNLFGSQSYLTFTFSLGSTNENIHIDAFNKFIVYRAFSYCESKGFITTKNFQFVLEEILNTDPEGPQKINLILSYLQLSNCYHSGLLRISSTNKLLQIFVSPIETKNKNKDWVMPLALLKKALKYRNDQNPNNVDT